MSEMCVWLEGHEYLNTISGRSVETLYLIVFDCSLCILIPEILCKLLKMRWAQWNSEFHAEKSDSRFRRNLLILYNSYLQEEGMSVAWWEKTVSLLAIQKQAPCSPKISKNNDLPILDLDFAQDDPNLVFSLRMSRSAWYCRVSLFPVSFVLCIMNWNQEWRFTS